MDLNAAVYPAQLCYYRPRGGYLKLFMEKLFGGGGMKAVWRWNANEFDKCLKCVSRYLASREQVVHGCWIAVHQTSAFSRWAAAKFPLRGVVDYWREMGLQGRRPTGAENP